MKFFIITSTPKMQVVHQRTSSPDGSAGGWYASVPVRILDNNQKNFIFSLVFHVSLFCVHFLTLTSV